MWFNLNYKIMLGGNKRAIFGVLSALLVGSYFSVLYISSGFASSKPTSVSDLLIPQNKFNELDEEGTPKSNSNYFSHLLDDWAEREVQSCTNPRDVENSHPQAAAECLKSKLSQVMVDGSTGVYNKGFFNFFLPAAISEFNRLHESERSLFLIFLDIDNFKNYNTVYGHVRVNAILRKFAETMNETIQNYADLQRATSTSLVRYGGDEFTVIMCCSKLKLEIVENLNQKLSEGVRGLTFPHLEELGSGVFIPLSISTGISEFAAGEKMEEFTHRADVLLHKMKERKRINRTRES